jgi:hypothetical protein
VLTLPGEWFADPQDWTGLADATALAALRTEHYPAHRAVRATPPDTAAGFDLALRTALGSGYAVLAYPGPASPVRAAVCLASWLGLTGSGLSTQIGGHVSVVESGIGHGDNQDWHTDSTPWQVPNRWTVLAHLGAAGATAFPPTGILPLAEVTAALAATDPGALVTLRSTPVRWRANFAALPDLGAPVLDQVQPRWVRPVVAEQLTDHGPDLVRAAGLLESVLARTDSAEAVVRPGRLLVLDNQAVLHRSPRLDHTCGRRLLRIKVGGLPVP